MKLYKLPKGTAIDRRKRNILQWQEFITTRNAYYTEEELGQRKFFSDYMRTKKKTYYCFNIMIDDPHFSEIEIREEDLIPLYVV